MNEIILAMCLSLVIADNCPRGIELVMPMNVEGAYGHNKDSGKPIILVNSKKQFTDAGLRNLLEHEMAHHFCQINYGDPCPDHGHRFKKMRSEVTRENDIKSVQIKAMRSVGNP